ncbi:MAG: hypothetical protein IPN69_00830 [Acidobacteria bacterium]|nr:hypothetical protein [Acidobacteriota bacterium]
MKKQLMLKTFVYLSLLTVGFAIPLAAQTIQVETAEKPVPFLAQATGAADIKIEVSAVVSIDDAGELLLAADDENSKLLVIEAKTGRVIDQLVLAGIDKPKPKWEGLAKDDEGAFYVIGGHTVKKEEESDIAKLKARSRVFRFFIIENDENPSGLGIDDSRILEWSVAESLVKEEKINNPANIKIKTEGLAVKTLVDANGKVTKRELVIGMREPGDPVRVMTADITALPADGAKLDMRRLFTFSSGSVNGVAFRLSSIEYAQQWKGFLILTSTEDATNNFHGNALWFAPDAGLGSPTFAPQKIWTFGDGIKAEGICVLPNADSSSKTMRAFLIYDNDGKTNSLLQSVVLARWAEK